MKQVVLYILVAGSVLACRGNVEQKPNPSTSAAPPVATAPKELPAIQVTVGDAAGTKSEQDTCTAAIRDATVEVSCYSPENSELEVTAAGQQPALAKGPRNDFARASGSYVSAVLSNLGDVAVPAYVDRPGRPKGPESLGRDGQSKLRLDPHITFKLKHHHTITPGTVAPFELPLEEALREAIPEFRKLAEKPLLFSGETPTDPAPTTHSILYLWGKSTYSAVQRADIQLGAAYVYGPAKRVRDADLIAVQTSAFSDGGKMCDGYEVASGPNKGQKKSLPLWIEKSTVVLRERRTAKEIARNEFTGEAKCPTGLDLTQNEKANSTVDDQKIEKWLLAQLPK